MIAKVEDMQKSLATVKETLTEASGERGRRYGLNIRKTICTTLKVNSNQLCKY